MNLFMNIRKFFIRPKAFLVECGHGKCCKKEVDTVRSMNVDVDSYNDYNKLLYALQSKSRTKYQIGLIHENGSKYSPQMLSNFIKKIDPTIQLIIYKNEEELKRETQTLVLT